LGTCGSNAGLPFTGVSLPTENSSVDRATQRASMLANLATNRAKETRQRVRPSVLTRRGRLLATNVGTTTNSGRGRSACEAQTRCQQWSTLVAQSSPAGPRRQLELIDWTGLRPGEALALRRDRIDFDLHHIVVERQATVTSRRRVEKRERKTIQSKRVLVLVPDAAGPAYSLFQRSKGKSEYRCMGEGRRARFRDTEGIWRPEEHVRAIGYGALAEYLRHASLAAIECGDIPESITLTSLRHGSILLAYPWVLTRTGRRLLLATAVNGCKPQGPFDGARRGNARKSGGSAHDAATRSVKFGKVTSATPP